VRAVAESVENQQKMRLVTNLVLHEVIEPYGNQQRGNDHNVQLYVNRASRQVAEPAAQGDEQVEQQNGQRRGGVRAAQTDEHVVQVRLVGMEWRLALQNARRHHAERVEDRNREHCQHEGNQPDMLCIVDFAAGAVRQRPHDEDRNHDAHDQRAAVADEHLRRFAEQVVQEEGYERPGCHQRQYGQGPVAYSPEHHTEEDACQDAVARRESVHSVHQIDCVDDAHGRHDRQRHGHILRNLVNAPQSVEVVEAVSSDVDQQQHRENLNQKPQCGREVEDIVERSGVEHNHHRHHDDEQLGAVVPESGAAQTDDRAEEDGDASQHGDRLALQLARVGVVDDVLVEGNLDQQRMNPPDAQQGNQERENEWHKYVYLSRDAWTCRAASGIWAIGTSRQGEIELM